MSTISLNCPIQYSRLIAPCTLTCGHTFNSKTLFTQLNATLEDSSTQYNCALCRKNISVIHYRQEQTALIEEAVAKGIHEVEEDDESLQNITKEFPSSDIGSVSILHTSEYLR